MSDDSGCATKRKLDQDGAPPKRANLRAGDDGDVKLAVADIACPPSFAGRSAVGRIGASIDWASPNGIAHDPVRGVTYVTDFYECIHRLRSAADQRGGPEAAVFCHHGGLVSAKCVPEAHRTPDRALVSWTDGAAVYAVSDAGTPKLLAGLDRTRGVADGDGVNARFRDIADLAFDSLGRVVVVGYARRVCRLSLDDGAVTTVSDDETEPANASGLSVTAYMSSQPSVAIDRHNNIYASGRYREALRRIDGATGAETLVRFARPSDDATMRRPRSLVYDPEGDRLFVADGARIWIAWPRTHELEVLADLGAWESDAAIALTSDADWHDEKLALALEPDARHVADIAARLAALDFARTWPPGLANVIVQYARPGLHILVAQRSTGVISRVAVGVSA